MCHLRSEEISLYIRCLLSALQPWRGRARADDFWMQLEDENAKLKRLVADLSLDKAMLQDVVSRSRRRPNEVRPTL